VTLAVGCTSSLSFKLSSTSACDDDWESTLLLLKNEVKNAIVAMYVRYDHR